MCSSKGTRNQYFAALSANLLSISYGASFGWVSSSYLQLQSPETSHLDSGPLTKDDLGWVTSILSLGILFGTLFFGWLADRIGRKRCFLFVAVPVVLNCLLIATARNVVQLCVARFLAGSVGGCCFTVIPAYITELAEDRLRSTLGTYMSLFMGIGALAVNILGYFFHYVTVAWIMLLIPAVFLATFVFNPDTPQYLEQHSKNGVEKSLRYYRGISSRAIYNEEFQTELDKLCKPSHKLKIGEDKHLHWKDFTHPKARKAFFIGVGIILANQLSGCLTMLKYATVIFKDAGSIQSPLVSAIIVICIQLVGTYSATLFVERAGRKTLLLLSTAGICLGQILMASFYYLSSLGFETSSFSWVPVAAFSLIVFAGAIGVMVVDFIVIAEITPPKIRSVILRVHGIILSLLATFIVKIFPQLSVSLGIPGVVSMFAVFSFILTIFIAICVPETKGKSIEAIQETL
ncbi:hypothetical protein ACLKA6_000382 [Drosophila palustris]